MFGTGIPILYPFACVFYFISFWVYKSLLIKFYAKPKNFKEHLPVFSTSYIKVGIVFHIIFGGLMLTNSQIIPSEEVIKAIQQGGKPEGTNGVYERYLSKTHG